MSTSAPDEVPGKRLAVLAESLYLVNLLLAPGLGFAALVWVWYRNRESAPPLAANHLRQTLIASVWAGVLLVGINGIAVLWGGWREPATWMVIILYFTLCHSTLVMLGILGLARALSGLPCVYPIIGRA